MSHGHLLETRRWLTCPLRAGSMEQRRAAWTARGWADDYKHVSPSEAEDALPAQIKSLSLSNGVNGAAEEETRAKPIPTHIWGEHEEEDQMA